MRLKLIKLTFYIFSIFLIFNISCKSSGKTPEIELPAEMVSEAQGAIESLVITESEAILEEVIEITDDTAAIEEITEAELTSDGDLEDLFVEELIAGIIEDFPTKQKPEPPVVTAVTTPPAPAQPAPIVPPAPAPLPVTPPQPAPTAPATPPVRETPPPAPVVQVPPTPIETELPAEESAPQPVRNYVPDYPATRLDSPAQMGRTPLDTEIIYSRIVRATVGQTVEIPFRGNGWVYLGETASRRGIVYNSRRNESEGQSFIFSLEEAGVYTLRFYRQDFIKDFIINDHVQVIVADAPQTETGWFSPPADRGKVIAQPRWPSPLEEAQIRSGVRLPSEPTVTAEPTPSASPRPSSTPRTSSQAPTAADRSSSAATRPSSTASQPSTAVQPPVASTQQSAATTQPSAAQSSASRQSDAPQASVTPPTIEAPETASAKREVLAPEVLLERAEKSFEGGKVDEAISYLNYFLEDYPSGSDELYWLLGQYYEANSPSRNILLSLDYYKRLVNEYPQSRRLNDARKRIAYLERFYINIQ